MPVETMTSANVKQAVPLFCMTNMEASLRFYVGGLGFKMKRWWWYYRRPFLFTFPKPKTTLNLRGRVASFLDDNASS